MLGKLLKYELPAMGRRLLPLYAAWAATAIFLGVATQMSSSKSDFASVISILLYTAIATAIMVMTVVMIIQRYSNSLLGDEAYFNQVLPVSMAAHIGNKLISATIWTVVTGIVALITILLAFLGGGFVVGFDSFQSSYINVPDKFWLYVFEFMLLMIAGIVKTIMQIYAAVTIGHQAQNHTTLASIGAYIGVLMFEGMVGRAMIGIIPSFNRVMYSSDGFFEFTQVFIPGFLAAAAFSALYFFICRYLMEKKLNLA